MKDYEAPYWATEVAYKNGYEAGKKQAFGELIEKLNLEKPSNPISHYDIGYNNGLTMALAIVFKVMKE